MHVKTQTKFLFMALMDEMKTEFKLAYVLLTYIVNNYWPLIDTTQKVNAYI